MVLTDFSHFCGKGYYGKSVTMGTQHNGLPTRPNKSSYSQYVIVRQQLDDLGYNAYLSNESVPLVERLVRDLIRCKEFHARKFHESSRQRVNPLSTPSS